jgi:hypothetical protein
LCFVLAASKRQAVEHDPKLQQEETERVLHPDDPLTEAGTIAKRVFVDPSAALPKLPRAMQTEGTRHWDALNEDAGAAFAGRNPRLAAPAPQHVLSAVPLAWRSATQDAQYWVRRFDMTAAGPLGRNGVHYSDTGKDREDALLNRPPPGTRDVCMVGSVAVPLERTYFFEERPNRVAQAQARAAEQQARAAEQQARAAEQHDERRRKRNAQAHRSRKARRMAQYESQKHEPAEQ